LRDLYKIYDDWGLALAAYNCGPGNMNRAIRRSGNRKDYWEIYYNLPRETRGFIPQYIAAVYAVNYYKEHNINPLPVSFPLAVDTVMINRDIHLGQISEVMGIPLGELRTLNPQYLTGLIPGSSRPYALILPMDRIGDFIDMSDSIRTHRASTYLGRSTQIANPTQSSASQPVNISGRTQLTYTVKSGDNLGFIADWYRVRLADLRAWNNIYTNTIRVGQRITVYVDPQQSEYFSRVNTMTFAEKQNMRGRTIPTNERPAATVNTQPATDGEYIIHIVRQGDTIWDIVRMYENVTSAEILALNNISDPSRIQLGQRQRIKKRS
jgi:membrane-bound lytic murein transglycosylase D